MDLTKILALITAAESAYSTAVQIAADVAQTFSTNDQAALQAQLAALKAQSDAAHGAFQAAMSG